jgi:hypothetical protein
VKPTDSGGGDQNRHNLPARSALFAHAIGSHDRRTTSKRCVCGGCRPRPVVCWRNSHSTAERWRREPSGQVAISSLTPGPPLLSGFRALSA